MNVERGGRNVEYPSFLWENISAVRGTLGFSSYTGPCQRANQEAVEGQPSHVLLDLVGCYDWDGTLARLATHPWEASVVGDEGRTPLHVACDQDAPPAVIRALLTAHPEAATMVGTSDMSPLHITCSSQRASVHVVKVLLDAGPREQVTSMRDVDGDTPLHAACRCGAPTEVLKVLLEANASIVDVRDYEGLTPLLRLWVRYFVTLGVRIIGEVRGPEDLVGELAEAWEKTNLLLQTAYCGKTRQPNIPSSWAINKNLRSVGTRPHRFSLVHAVAGVDCPRPIVKIAAKLHPEQLLEPDDMGRVPLTIACMTPIFRVHDLSDDGYCIEDQIHGDEIYNDIELGDHDEGRDHQENAHTPASNSVVHEPSVVDILLGVCPKAAKIRDGKGRLPLNVALESGKTWPNGVRGIVKAHPEAAILVDPATNLYPFVTAACNYDTSTSYELLRRDPELIRLGINKSAADRSEENTCKRQLE